jgi:hypothetical protein
LAISRDSVKILHVLPEQARVAIQAPIYRCNYHDNRAMCTGNIPGTLAPILKTRTPRKAGRLL